MKKFFFLIAVTMLTGMSIFAQEQEIAAPVSPQEQEQQQANTQTQPEPEPKERPVEFHLTFFNAGIALHFPLAIEGSAELVSIGFQEYQKTSLGGSFSPFYIFAWAGFRAKDLSVENIAAGNDNSKFALAADIGASLINLSAYWNAAKFLFPKTNNIILGPYTEFHWLFIDFLSGGIDAPRIRWKVGIEFGKINGNDTVKYHPMTVEIAYLLDGNHIPASQLGNTQIGPNDSKFFVGIKGGR